MSDAWPLEGEGQASLNEATSGLCARCSQIRDTYFYWGRGCKWGGHPNTCTSFSPGQNHSDYSTQRKALLLWAGSSLNKDTSKLNLCIGDDKAHQKDEGET